MSRSTTKRSNKTIACPAGCGRELPLEAHPTGPGRVIAYCDCQTKFRRAVYEAPGPDTGKAEPAGPDPKEAA
jgi:hypothetical protein